MESVPDVDISAFIVESGYMIFYPMFGHSQKRK
jgi:hypothetical protein